jgi:hypothetical protein
MVRGANLIYSVKNQKITFQNFLQRKKKNDKQICIVFCFPSL